MWSFGVVIWEGDLMNGGFWEVNGGFSTLKPLNLSTSKQKYPDNHYF